MIDVAYIKRYGFKWSTVEYQKITPSHNVISINLFYYSPLFIAAFLSASLLFSGLLLESSLDSHAKHHIQLPSSHKAQIIK